MGKKSRVKNRQADHRRRRGGPSSAVPLWLRPPLQGVPRQCRRAGPDVRRPPVRRDVVASGPHRDARARPRGHGSAEAQGLRPLGVLCSLLPVAAPALVREDGSIWLGLQVQHSFGDPSRDLGAVLEKALATEREGVVGLTDPPGEGSRLQDLVADQPLEVTVHDGFDYWVADVDDPTGAVQPPGGGQRRGHPTVRLASVEAAYWTNVGTKEHLRWVMPHEEDQLLTALARLHAAGKDKVADDSRLVGMFRVHGVLVPVWDLPVGTGAEVLEEPAARFAADLEKALADDAPSRRRSAPPETG